MNMLVLSPNDVADASWLAGTIVQQFKAINVTNMPTIPIPIKLPLTPLLLLILLAIF